jgi:hypothetical protein
MRKFIPHIIITLLFIGALAWFFNPSNLPPERGEIGFFQGSFVAVDQASFAQMKQAIEGNDAALFARLRGEEKVLQVPGRVRVRALTAMDANLMQVEILEGEHQGRTVWVQGAQVKRQ